MSQRSPDHSSTWAIRAVTAALLLVLALIPVSCKNSDGGGGPTVVPPDADADALLDAIEEAGWEIYVDFSGYGSVDGANLTTVFVTSDIDTTDTDGDGLSDYVEYQLRTNPRNTDTDGDGLNDHEEVHRWLSNPSSVDSDGDARLAGGVPNALLFDGNELNLLCDGNHPGGVCYHTGTSPTLADSDGDGLSDHEEFDNPIRHPLRAEIPELSVEIDSEIQIFMDIEYSISEGESEERSYETSLERATSSSTSTGEEREESYSTAFSQSLEIGIAYETGVDGGVTYHATAQFEASQESSWGSSRSFETTQESSRSASETHGEILSASTESTETFSSGTIETSVRLINTGAQTYDLTDVAIAVIRRSPVRNDQGVPSTQFGQESTLLATLLPDISNVVLGPGETSEFFPVSAEVSNPDQVRELLRDVTTLEFRPINAALLTADGLDYDFLIENSFSRCARVQIVRGAPEPELHAWVATNVERTAGGGYAGVSLLNVLSEHFGQAINEEPVVATSLEELGEVVGAPNEVAFAQIGDQIYLTTAFGLGFDFGDEHPSGRGRTGASLWAIGIQRRNPANIQENPDVRDLQIFGGDTVTLTRLTDDDQDGVDDAVGRAAGILSASNGSDFDGDGIENRDEVFGTGWVVAEHADTADEVAVRDAKGRVFSSARLADADQDGLIDGVERALRTDPNDPDTDNDTIPDALDPFPLDKARVLHVDAAQTDDSADGTSWESAYPTLHQALAFARDSNQNLMKESHVSEIWVADGDYTGYHQLVPGISVYGGFQGLSAGSGGEQKRSERNPSLYESRFLPSGGATPPSLVGTVPQDSLAAYYLSWETTGSGLTDAQISDFQANWMQDHAPTGFVGSIDGFTFDPSAEGEKGNKPAILIAGMQGDPPAISPEVPPVSAGCSGHAIPLTSTPFTILVEETAVDPILDYPPIDPFDWQVVPPSQDRWFSVVTTEQTTVTISVDPVWDAALEVYDAGCSTADLTVEPLQFSYFGQGQDYSAYLEFDATPGVQYHVRILLFDVEVPPGMECQVIPHPSGDSQGANEPFLGFTMRNVKVQNGGSLGAAVHHPRVTFDSCEFTGMQGGAVRSIPGSSSHPNPKLRLLNCLVTECTGLGGAYAQGTELEMVSCTFQNNRKAVALDGRADLRWPEPSGGVLFDTWKRIGKWIRPEGTSTSHFPSGGLGAALELVESTASLDRCRFIANETNLLNNFDPQRLAPYPAGGMCHWLGANNPDQKFMQKVKKQDRDHWNEFAGMLLVDNNDGSRLAGAGERSNGGAISSWGGRLIVTNSEFVKNRAGRAGAVYLAHFAESAFTNCSFVDNRAKDVGVYAKDMGVGHRADWSGTNSTNNAYYDSGCNDKRPSVADALAGHTTVSVNFPPFLAANYVVLVPENLTGLAGGTTSAFDSNAQDLNKFADTQPRFVFTSWNSETELQELHNNLSHSGAYLWNKWVRTGVFTGGDAVLNGKPLATNAGAVLADYTTQAYMQNCILWQNHREDRLWTRITSGWTVGQVFCDDNPIPRMPSVIIQTNHPLATPKDPLNHVSGVNVHWENSCVQYGDRPVALLDGNSEDDDFFVWTNGEDVQRHGRPNGGGGGAPDISGICWIDHITVNGVQNTGCSDGSSEVWDLNALEPNLDDSSTVLHSQIGSELYPPADPGLYPYADSFVPAEIVTGDPGFVSLSAGNLNLDDGSSCINAGFSAVDIDPFTPGTQALPALDLNGNPRVSGTAVDIGARESSGD